MKLAIGCPIYQREWCLPRWFQCIFDQKMNPKNIDLVFAYTKGTDNTEDIIIKYGKKFNSVNIIDCNDLPAFDNRDSERFYPLVILRNRIFEVLREIQPDYYFSYDSDILIPEGTIKGLLKDKKDIVGPWLDLVPPGGIPNCATMTHTGGFKRYKPYEKFYPKQGVYEVSTVFAVSLMENKVFNTCNYKWHKGGEDFGFAEEVIKAGFKSFVDANFIAEHLYRKDV